jgi:hypothetical protein
MWEFHKKAVNFQTKNNFVAKLAYQLLAHGRWFSPGTPTSSTTKTGRHDITEIVESDAKHHTLSILLFLFLQK